MEFETVLMLIISILGMIVAYLVGSHIGYQNGVEDVVMDFVMSEQIRVNLNSAVEEDQNGQKVLTINFHDAEEDDRK